MIFFMTHGYLVVWYYSLEPFWVQLVLCTEITEYIYIRMFSCNNNKLYCVFYYCKFKAISNKSQIYVILHLHLCYSCSLAKEEKTGRSVA